MDSINGRPYREQRDWELVADRLLAYRAAIRIDAYPTVWRFRLLVTSRAWEPGHDTRSWEDATGRMIGFAMLWQRRRGLGRAVLFASLQGLQAWGSAKAMLITISTNKPTVGLYSTTGFRRVDIPETGIYERQIPA